MKNHDHFKQEEERRYPDSPDGIVVAAVNNKSFARRFIDAFRLAKEGVKNNGRR